MTTHVPRNWIAVASADHVALGRAGRYMQVGHGKRAPLVRLRGGDRVAYYSPAQQLGARKPLQAFTAIGRVLEGEPYPFDMGGGFVPFRRDVAFAPSQSAAIRPLLDALFFAQPRAQWGAKFRYGLFPIDDNDLLTIAQAMQADCHALGLAH